MRIAVRTLVLLLAVTFAACSGAVGTSIAVRSTHSPSEAWDSLPVGSVAVYSADMVLAERRVELLEVGILRPDAGLELLAARVNFNGGTSDRVHLNTNPGGGRCTDTWPPEGFGPSYDPAGLVLEPGDHISINFYVQATEPGEYTAEGVVVRYRDGARTVTMTSDALTIHYTFFPPDEPREIACNPTLPFVWFEPWEFDT